MASVKLAAAVVKPPKILLYVFTVVPPVIFKPITAGEAFEIAPDALRP